MQEFDQVESYRNFYILFSQAFIADISFILYLQYNKM